MTIFNKINDDWKSVKNHCRTTVRKNFTEKEPSEDFKKKLLISEHSPIRLIEFDWSWKGIKYWVSTEWSRHKFEKFISSQRNDRQNEYDRNKAPQDSLVNFDGFANMQNVIDAWRKRLCFCATKEARELAEDFKIELAKTNMLESDVLVPNCIYRCGCPEMNGCGFFNKFKEYFKSCGNNFDITNIENRYKIYNVYFHERRNNMSEEITITLNGKTYTKEQFEEEKKRLEEKKITIIECGANTYKTRLED